jgi:hypothetical protein
MRRSAGALAPLLTLALSSAAGLAQTPCDLLPENGTRVETVTKPGPAVPKPKVGPCPPGSHPDGNQCRFPDVTEPKTVPTKPREDCQKALKVSIDEVRDIDGLKLSGNTIYRPGTTKLLLVGNGAANATSAEIGGGIHLEIGAAASRLGNSPRSTCVPPNCQVVYLEIPAGTPDGPQSLKVYTPKRYASAAVTLNVRPAPTPAYSMARGGRVVSVGGGTGGTQPQGSVRPPRDQSASAALGCPGTETPYGRTFQTNQPSAVFEIRSAQVQATATAQWMNTRTNGVPNCVWTEAFAFTIKALDGQGDVTVSWNAQHANNYSNPLALSTSQPVTLTKGRWQIVPDATFPPDFAYTVSFRD